MVLYISNKNDINNHVIAYGYELSIHQGPAVQSVISLTSSLRVISLTVLADSIYNILIFFAEKNVSSFCTAKATHIFFSKKFQHICISLDVNFNESLTNNVVSFEQLGPELIISNSQTYLNLVKLFTEINEECKTSLPSLL